MSQIEKYFFWRSMAQKGASDGDAIPVEGEFPQDASVMADPASRRSFLKLMGASLALAGLTGCKGIRKPVQTIRPYAKQPEYAVTGKSVFYATAMSVGERVSGLLVKSLEGRPTKIEGNPAHPNSLGATNSYDQAAVLDLYDPDRLQSPRVNGKDTSMDAFMTWLAGLLRNGGRHSQQMAFLLPEQTSPTMMRILKKVRKKYPNSPA